MGTVTSHLGEMHPELRDPTGPSTHSASEQAALARLSGPLFLCSG